jgi:hypothetical protein
VSAKKSGDVGGGGNKKNEEGTVMCCEYWVSLKIRTHIVWEQFLLMVVVCGKRLL